jgi:dCTP deaminase
MAFWSSKTLLDRLPKLISPFDEKRIKHGAYELALGDQAFVTGEAARSNLPPDGEVVIPQGQFALLLTDETIVVPSDAIAFISMKSGNKFRGLINVSGFHVDPGWEGKLIFSVFNAGVQEIHISRGKPLFMLWFAYLDSPTTDLYQGTHKGQTAIPDGMITNVAVKHPSPSALQKEIAEVRKDVQHSREVLGMLVALAATAVVAFLVNVFRPATPSSPVNVTISPNSAIMSPAPSPLIPASPAASQTPIPAPSP